MNKWRWSLKFDPNQPRVPVGDPRGGQWASGKTGLPSSLLGTEERKALAGQLDAELGFMASGSYFGGNLLDGVNRAVIVGSFAGDKKVPGDVDVLLEVDKISKLQDSWNTTQFFRQNQDIYPKRTDKVDVVFIKRGDRWFDDLITEGRNRYGAEPIDISEYVKAIAHEQ